MENEQLREAIAQQLARVELDIFRLLRQAHVLEDGRRVFKSEDGSFVIDEFGEKVSPEEVDFDSVTGPTAETYLERMSVRLGLEQQQNALNEEHQQLLKTQEHIDAAREEIADGDITVDELEALDAELLDLMPDTARIHAGLEPRTSELAKVAEAQSAKPAIQMQTAEAASPTPTGM